MSPDASLRHLISLRDLPSEAFAALLDAAERLAGPAGREPLLRGRRLGMLFFQSSLRTRTAFEVACLDLGAHALHFQVGGGLWRLEHRDGVRMDGDAAEHVREGIGVLGRMLDGLGVRSFAGLEDPAEDARDAVIGAIARASSVPVLSLESAMDHPHQGLADALTVRRRYGRERVR
ncbi:MAG: Rossmann-fold NAD(P)-binding domain-containing protein, partial [Planctomycetota bacterium]